MAWVPWFMGKQEAGGQNIWPRVMPQISIEVTSRPRSISISYFMAFSDSIAG
ncbi:MAG TPA: hypothetical protein VM621_16045 [Luteibacter sp.]|uniref:hypothetical protein n=1 Tax=Luteibacter sp. TaxID=1886636 RepID=UPI002C3007DA|nr:hypothetical protein [Luteibacter sp.]HVI56554.1 hypothetical protein [Luteibacter sp.]